MIECHISQVKDSLSIVEISLQSLIIYIQVIGRANLASLQMRNIIRFSWKFFKTYFTCERKIISMNFVFVIYQTYIIIKNFKIIKSIPEWLFDLYSHSKQENTLFSCKIRWWFFMLFCVENVLVHALSMQGILDIFVDVVPTTF